MRVVIAIVLVLSMLYVAGRFESAPEDFASLSAGDISPDPSQPLQEITRQALPPAIQKHMLAERTTDLSTLLTLSEDEINYLLSLQDEAGVISQTPEHVLAIPYFSNMAALAMLSDPRGQEPVRRYMEWYLAHLNRPDRFGMIGTIYDYKKVGGRWVSTRDYDSADSYAATFLTLALNYTNAAGDLTFAEDNLQSLVDVAEVLIRLQDEDGLIWVKPRLYIKFLMDNAENYRGLNDAAELMRLLGRNDLAERYRQAALRVASGIEQRLWLENRQVYAWALYGRSWQRVPRKRWYPDTVAQIYPVVFRLLPASSARAEHLYAHLNTEYPHWTQGEFDDRFPWTVLAYMAALMEDDTRAVAYMESIREKELGHGRNYPWHAFESAFFFKTLQKLDLRYPALTEQNTASPEQLEESRPQSRGP